MPQGSVLGPLLFLLYINDIHTCSSLLSFILFADDTNLFISGKNIEELEILVNREMKCVQVWLEDNQLTLNLKKTNYVVFKSHKKQCKKELKIKLNEYVINKANNTKFLGVIIDEHLTWKNHISYVTCKIAKTVGVLCKARHVINQDLLLSLYYSLIYPHLIYGNIVWGNNYKTRLDRVIKMQKKVVRIITFSSYTESSKPLFQKLQILNVDQINSHQTILFMFDLFNNKLPYKFNDVYVLNSQLHSYGTRQSNNIHKQFYRTNYGYYSIQCKGTELWNSFLKI